MSYTMSPKPKLTQKKQYSGGGSGGKGAYSFSHYGAFSPSGSYTTKGNGVFKG